MWTVVYVAQREDEAEKIRAVLRKGKIISRTRRINSDGAKDEMCFEIMVPSAELEVSQNLIIAAEL